MRRQTPSGPTAIDPQTQRWQQLYIVEADATGEQVIPPFALSFREANAAPDAGSTTVQTEPLAITVTSVLPQDADVQAPRDIAPPVELVPPLLPPWPWIAAALLGLVVVVGLLLWWRRRARRPVPPPPPRPAHELALEALQRLQRDNLMEQQAIEAFYVRLSFILRQYIEWRFGAARAGANHGGISRRGSGVRRFGRCASAALKLIFTAVRPGEIRPP